MISNITILFGTLLLNFFLLTVSYVIFGKKGIVTYIIMSVIAGTLQISTSIVYFSIGDVDFTATLGLVMFGGVFLATDLLSEKYGEEESKKAIHISTFSTLAFVLLMYASTLFVPTDTTQEQHDGLITLFGANGQILISLLVYVVLYLITQNIDIRLFAMLKEKFPSDKHLWIRNNGSTFVSQSADSLLFVILFGLFGIIPAFESVGVFFTYLFTTLVIRYIIALLDTPFLYIMKYVQTAKPEDDK